MQTNMSLFILGGSLTGLALIRNAHSLGLLPILFSDSDEISTHSKFSKLILVDDTAEQAFSQIQQQSRQCNKVFLIASSDIWIRFIIRFRQQIENLGIKILHAKNTTLEICLNKTKFNEWVFREKLPAPPMFAVPDLNTNNLNEMLKGLPYPLIVRPSITSHSDAHHLLLKAQTAFNANELESCLRLFEKARTRPVITQSLIPFQSIQYSVAVVREGNEMRSFVAKKIRPSIEHLSTGTFVSLSPSEDVELLARLAIDRLDYFGIAEVEILKRTDTGELFLIEINARPWLQYMLAWRSKHDFLRFLIKKDSYCCELENKTGFHWISFNSDLFVAFSSSIGAVRNGKLSFREYLRSLKQANVFSCFCWNDLRPSFIGFKELIRLITSNIMRQK
jgi:predicted ATP-grasp superfamily ATP-dependent carboligase